MLPNQRLHTDAACAAPVSSPLDKDATMMRFSRNTIIELIRAFDFRTHASLQQVALQFGLEDALGGEGIAKKETRLMEYLIRNPELSGPQGDSLIFELIEFLFEQRCGVESWRNEDPETAFPSLLNALRHDGYTVDGLKLRSVLPESVPVAQEEDELRCLLRKYGFTTTHGHLEQAIAAHTRGDWASANSQLRSFIEALFDGIAQQLSEGSTEALKSSHARREWLAKCTPAFFDSALNEWEINDKGGFVQGFWKRLHPEGSHPGLSDERDCTFRLHLVIIVAGYFLRRFDQRANCI
jgi:hypothetical protein